MGVEGNKPFDLLEFVQSIFDKIKIPEKQGLYIWGADAVIRVDLIPDQGKIYVRFNDTEMGVFESYKPGDAAQGNLCVFQQKYRYGMKKHGSTPEETLMMNIVEGNKYVRVFRV